MRQVGAISTGGEFEGSEKFAFFQRPLNSMVKLCRNCGEVAVKNFRYSTSEEDADFQRIAEIRSKLPEVTGRGLLIQRLATWVFLPIIFFNIIYIFFV